MIAYPDACPTCDPATHPASLPDLAGVYACPSGHRWRTTHDVFGWPVERARVSVPVLPAPGREAA